MAIRRVAVPLPTSGGASNGSAGDAPNVSQEKTNAAAEAARRQLNNIPFIGGVWLKSITVPTGIAGQTVAHQLRATPRGYIVTRSSGGPAIYSPQQTWSDKVMTFYNSSGSDQTMDVWIF